MLSRYLFFILPVQEVSLLTGTSLDMLNQPWKSQQKFKELSRNILKPCTCPGLLTFGLLFR